MNQNTSSKDFWKPSVLVWHGLNTNVSQIKKKKVGAWPLCFFLIVAYMIYVFHFSFDISLRKKIFFLWCHTNTHGIDLRRTPPMLVQTTPNMLQNCNQKTTFTQDFDCNILFLQIFQRKDLLCCESFSATRCSLLTLPAPTLNQMAEKTFHCSDEKLSRGKKREIPC